MKLIKTSLLALAVAIGLFSNAQETGSVERAETKKEVKTTTKLTTADFKTSPELTAASRAEELRTKVQLTDEQYSKVKDLFLKVENRKNALNGASEDDKTKATNDLKTLENRELDNILTPAQKKIVSSPKTENKASNM
jgi:uncharacterized protein with von Willebrand factor type A (vWA) domain